MGFNGQWSNRQVPAESSEIGQILSMNWQLVNLYIVRSIGRVRPPEDCVGGGMDNVLGVWAREVGGEWHVERVVDGGIGGLW